MEGIWMQNFYGYILPCCLNTLDAVKTELYVSVLYDTEKMLLSEVRIRPTQWFHFIVTQLQQLL